MRFRGEPEACRGALLEASTILEEIGDLPCSTGAALQLVGADAVTGRRDEARARLAESARASVGMVGGHQVRAIDMACLLALELDDHAFAARLLGTSEQAAFWAARDKEIPRLPRAPRRDAGQRRARALRGRGSRDDDRSAEGSRRLGRTGQLRRVPSGHDDI